LCLACAPPLRVSCSSPLPPPLSSIGLAPSCFAAGSKRTVRPPLPPGVAAGPTARPLPPGRSGFRPLRALPACCVWAVCSPPFPYSLSPSRVSLAGSRPLCAPLLRVAWWCPPLPPPLRRLAPAFAPLPCVPLLSPFCGLHARLRAPSARLLFPPARCTRGSSFLAGIGYSLSPLRVLRVRAFVSLCSVSPSRVSLVGVSFLPSRLPASASGPFVLLSRSVLVYIVYI
jgi:hypothetical protein